MKKGSKDTGLINMNNVYQTQNNEHKDEESIDIDCRAKDYPIVEHLSNARLMPMTGPMGKLDFFDTFEYSSVPDDPATALEPYELIMEKNKQK